MEILVALQHWIYSSLSADLSAFAVSRDFGLLAVALPIGIVLSSPALHATSSSEFWNVTDLKPVPAPSSYSLPCIKSSDDRRVERQPKVASVFPITQGMDAHAVKHRNHRIPALVPRRFS